MFKLNRRSFLKITLLVGYVLFFNKDVLNAEEEKFIINIYLLKQIIGLLRLTKKKQFWVTTNKKKNFKFKKNKK